MSNAFIKEQREMFLKIIWSMLNTPYIYGGFHPEHGIDCSGTVVEAARAVAKIGPKADYNAQGFWDMWSPKYQVEKPVAGALAFWFDETGHCYHVAVCISEFFCMTADGGGSATDTLEEAKAADARVKIRLINHRKTAPKYVDIFRE